MEEANWSRNIYMYKGRMMDASSRKTRMPRAHELEGS